jgi:hypothetical protein
MIDGVASRCVDTALDARTAPGRETIVTPDTILRCLIIGVLATRRRQGFRGRSINTMFEFSW